MTTGQVLLILLGLLLNGWTQWFLSYFKKEGEFRSIKENLETVLKQVEEMKSDIDVAKDGRIHLQREARQSMFEMSDAAELYWNALDELTKIVDDETSKPILKEMTQSFLTYIRKRNRYMLLSKPSITQIGREQTLIKSLTDLKNESLKYINDSNVCGTILGPIAFEAYLKKINEIHAKHDALIIKNLKEFNNGIGEMLQSQTKN